MFDISLNWQSIKEKIREDYDLTEISYKTWILPLRFKSIEDNTVTISVPSDHINPNLIKYLEKNYTQSFSFTISELLGYQVDVRFELDTDSPKDTKQVKQDEPSAPVVQKTSKSSRSNLIERYNFNSFIKGDTNALAYSAAVAVAENPGINYNPLYIYGGPGLGKTHLMHSIGHYILENNPDMNVLYVQSDVFTADIVEGIRTGNAPQNMANIRNKYNSIDVFLIDDIQYIIGKDRTQIEFFNIFNSLHMSNKQIVISSDKPPSQLEYLEERFRSRFEMGLTVDIKAPDYETRIAILTKNAENTHKSIEKEVLEYIATNIKSNIRELEGALNRLVAYMSLNSIKVLTMEHALDALKDLVYPDSSKSLSLNLIIEKVGEYYNISYDDLVSKKRNAEIVEPRHIAMYLCRTLTDCSYLVIAKQFNKNDHSTVKHAENKIKSDMEKNVDIRRTINIIKERISPGL